MSPRKFPISNTKHQPKLTQQQTNLFHNQLHPTITFGGITHHITPSSLHRASMFKTPKANSYSQPNTLPMNNNKAAPKHADSEKSSAPRVQHDANNNHAPANSDAQTAVSNWLATSQDFEKPPAPAPVMDPPALPERRGREYWLGISKDLDLRLKARSEGFKAPDKLAPSRAYADPVFDRRFELDFLKIEKEKLTPRKQLNASTEILVPFSPVTMGPPRKLGSERKKAIEASIFKFKEKLEKHKPEPEQLEGVKENKADETVEVTTRQIEVTKSKEADDVVRAKEKKEQLEAAEAKKADEAVIVRAKAKKLAADAIARNKEEQERKKYVEGRARDIHENLLHYRPFDMDAVRREFSEEEVRDIKEIVRALGLAKMKMR